MFSLNRGWAGSSPEHDLWNMKTIWYVSSWTILIGIFENVVPICNTQCFIICSGSDSYLGHREHLPDSTEFFTWVLYDHHLHLNTEDISSSAPKVKTTQQNPIKPKHPLLTLRFKTS